MGWLAVEVGLVELLRLGWVGFGGLLGGWPSSKTGK